MGRHRLIKNLPPTYSFAIAEQANRSLRLVQEDLHAAVAVSPPDVRVGHRALGGLFRWLAAKNRLDEGTWASAVAQAVQLVFTDAVEYTRQIGWLRQLRAVIASRKAKPDPRVR
jgi:hypothetical protein